jgi:hypothetical protein
MNPDEFQYYFELEELEPFAGVPRTELFGHADSTNARNHLPVPASNSPARSRTDTPSAGDAGSTAVTTEQPWSEQGSRSSPSGADARQWESARANASSAGAHSRDSRSPPPRSDIPAYSAERRPAEQVARDFVSADASHAHVSKGAAVSTRTSAPSESAWRDRMSVHVLGQFAFCGRAGIYSAENGDETDLDEPLPQWGYLPNFDLERIEEQLAKLLRQLWLLLGLIVIFIVGMVGGVALQDRRIFYPALLGVLVCGVSVFNTVVMVLTLLWRRAAARRAQAREPDRAIDRIQAVNWWSLLKAGFDPVPCQRQFRHPRLALEGSPWRVLERGSLRIPVIKSGARKLGDAKHAIYPKHELRLAAYAMLLEATEHVQVPYGVIFLADSHLGLAIPITEFLRNQVAEQLERANDLIVRSQRGESEPRPPADRNRCATCRLGEPIAISDSDIRSARKSRTSLLVLKDPSERKFHCACGDRFGSAPPHRRIINLGLTSTVE